jgi:hypothetical protein
MMSLTTCTCTCVFCSTQTVSWPDLTQQGPVIWPGLSTARAWFDRYRLPPLRMLVRSIVRRVQERFPIAQHRARKRRRLLQRLAA